MMIYIEELNARVMLELSEILLFCETCEYQTLELLKVANCVFSRDEFYALVDSYKKFRSNVVILENLIIQLDEPITMLQVLAVKSMVRALKKNFDELIEKLELANTRIDSDEINFDAAQLIHKLLDIIPFEVIDFDNFEKAIKDNYFIMQLRKPLHADYDDRYGDLSLLVISSFKTRRLAYAYALKNGISKDKVWSIYD